MIEQVTFQTLFQFLQTVGILVGVSYYVVSLRNQSRARQIQIISTVGTGNLDWSFLNWEVDDYTVFMSEHGPEADPEGWNTLNEWFNRLEVWGVYVREGLLDVRLVCLMSGGTSKESWEKYRGIFEEWRLRYDRPRDWVEAEYMYERVVRARSASFCNSTSNSTSSTCDNCSFPLKLFHITPDRITVK